MKGIAYHRGSFTFEGLLYIILGIAGLVLCGMFSEHAQLIYGLVFLGSCVVTAIRSFASVAVPGFLLSLLAALVYLIAGIWLVSATPYSVDGLILFLALLFWIQGVIDLLVSLQRFETSNWGLMFIGGIIVIVLAFIIWIQTGMVSAWTISVLVGINYFVYAVATLLTSMTAIKPQAQHQDAPSSTDSEAGGHH